MEEWELGMVMVDAEQNQNSPALIVRLQILLLCRLCSIRVLASVGCMSMMQSHEQQIYGSVGLWAEGQLSWTFATHTSTAAACGWYDRHCCCTGPTNSFVYLLHFAYCSQQQQQQNMFGKYDALHWMCVWTTITAVSYGVLRTLLGEINLPCEPWCAHNENVHAAASHP